jgi:hypothetical protein
VQHGSPLPPQATQVVLEQTVKGALHPTAPAQQACPIAPHVPHPLVLAEQACAFAQLFPAVTHRWFDSSQQPPLHELPGQQGWPAPPQLLHWPPPEHACPATVQKSPDVPWPFELPGQQLWPFPPQLPAWQLPPEPQLPTSPPQVAWIATHPPAVQHKRLVLHE